MRVKRLTHGIAGILGCVLTAVFAAGPAQAMAAPQAPYSSHKAPNSPSPSHRSAFAVPPTVSPPADFIHHPPGTSFSCAPGNLCVEVWDPTVAQWKVFFLRDCRRYALSDWQGTGTLFNNSASTAYFYGRNGSVLAVAPGRVIRTQDWTPVGSIRPC